MHDRNNPECRLHVNEEELPAADEVARLRTECQELVDSSDDITQGDIWVEIFSCRSGYQVLLRDGFATGGHCRPSVSAALQRDHSTS
jgi:hypothetical protein